MKPGIRNPTLPVREGLQHIVVEWLTKAKGFAPAPASQPPEIPAPFAAPVS